MSYTHLTTETDRGIAVVTFRRGDQLNAMNAAMMRDIIAALKACDADPEVGVVILTGEGRAFMAGADIKEYAAFQQAEFDRFQADGRALYEAIETSSKPVIAAVNGVALGGGFEIALACDFIVARTGARLGLPEISLGLVPGGGGTQRLTRKLGFNRAFEMMATGEARTAETLQEWGLVSRVAPDARLTAIELAGTLVAQFGPALTALKSLCHSAVSSSVEIGMARELEALRDLHHLPEPRRRIAAFAERSIRPKQEASS